MIKVCFFGGLDFGEGPRFVTGQNNRGTDAQTRKRRQDEECYKITMMNSSCC